MTETARRHEDKDADLSVPGGADRTVDSGEIEKFAAIAEAWWDPDGDFKPLHKLNPIRLAYIRDQLCGHFERDPKSLRPFEGLTVCDIGCGGGLLCEPLARLGARVTGIDATERSVEIARAHAAEMGLEIDYRFATVESLAEAGERFDVVVNMEVVEHVADVDGFLAASARLVGPGGAMLLSTLNRTAKSYLLGIVGAEMVLRWLPRGTHEWNKFLRPSELAGAIRPHGFAFRNLRGIVYNPIKDEFRLSSRDLDVNYLGIAVRN